MTDVSDKIDELESTIEEQATRIESLEEQLEQQRQPSTTRRAALKGGGLLAMFGLASQPASASGDLTVPGTVSANSISTEEADITGETYVKAHLENDINNVSAGTFTNFLDTEDADSLGEFNASQQFSPSETGDYDVVAQADVNVGADGDEVIYRVQNVTDGFDVINQGFQIGGSGFPRVPFVATAELQTGKTYELQVTDNNSSFSILSASQFTRAVIRRSVVHA